MRMLVLALCLALAAGLVALAGRPRVPAVSPSSTPLIIPPNGAKAPTSSSQSATLPRPAAPGPASALPAADAGARAGARAGAASVRRAAGRPASGAVAGGRSATSAAAQLATVRAHAARARAQRAAADKASRASKASQIPSMASCPVRRRYPAAAQGALSRLAGSGSQLLVGVEPDHGPYQMWRATWFACAVDHPVDLVQYAQPFDQPFYEYLADRVWAQGSVPVLSWEPWSYRAGVQGDSGALVSQPRYSLRTIYQGAHDRYLRAFARAVRRAGRPLLLRFAPEMNGSWNSWSEGVNGNQPGDYVRAWRHVHDLFAAEGVRNVLWVWSPDADCGDCRSLARYYPGSRYVDVVALDGYNWGHLHPWNAWRSFDEIFQAPLQELERLAPGRPELIAETASTEIGGSKSAWISDFLSQLSRYPALAGFTWFNMQKETDWRVQSSAAARDAFVLGLRRAPAAPAAGLLRRRIEAIEERYLAALAAGRLYP